VSVRQDQESLLIATSQSGASAGNVRQDQESLLVLTNQGIASVGNVRQDQESLLLLVPVGHVNQDQESLLVLIPIPSSALIPTTTTITSIPDPSNLGTDVIFTANVSGAGTPSPSGTITFYIGGPGYGRDTGYGLDPYGDPALFVVVLPASPNGAGKATAQFQTTALAVGSYFAYAVYSGDSVYTTSTSPEIIQLVIAIPVTTGTIVTDFGNSTADVIWWHTGFTGYDEETLANEGLINTGGTPNIPWLLGLSVSMGNAMTEAIAKQNIIYCEPEWGWDGGGGGNEAGDSQIGAGGSSGGLIVGW
jgi:hypothetical protein